MSHPANPPVNCPASPKVKCPCNTMRQNYDNDPTNVPPHAILSTFVTSVLRSIILVSIFAIINISVAWIFTDNENKIKIYILMFFGAVILGYLMNKNIYNLFEF